MKLPTILISTFSSAWLAGASLTNAAPTPPLVAERPVLWSIHFDNHRLRTGIGRNFIDVLSPFLESLSTSNHSAPGSALESVALYGFEPTNDANEAVPFLADLNFSSEGDGVSQRFDAISKKRHLTIEQIGTYPSIHFDLEGQQIWIAKYSDSRLLVGASRALLEKVLTPGTDNFVLAPSENSNELLGGSVEIGRLLADNHALRKSELLKLLPHLDFHITDTVEQQLNLDATAELDSERSATRAARIIEGMTAAMSLRDAKGVPWDERLNLTQDGPHLALKFHLDPQEVKVILDRLVRELQAQVNSAKSDE